MGRWFALLPALLMAGTQGVYAQDAGGAGDPVAGAKRANICKTCHQFGPDAENGIGPVLNGVVGRKAGTLAGYDYSDAMKNSGLTWDPATLKRFLHDPRGTVPGTKMTFAGLSKQSELDNVVAFLSTLGPDGKAKPADAPAATAPAATDAKPATP